MTKYHNQRFEFIFTSLAKTNARLFEVRTEPPSTIPKTLKHFNPKPLTSLAKANASHPRPYLKL
jgi:hypothetical protein